MHKLNALSFRVLEQIEYDTDSFGSADYESIIEEVPSPYTDATANEIEKEIIPNLRSAGYIVNKNGSKKNKPDDLKITRKGRALLVEPA